MRDFVVCLKSDTFKTFRCIKAAQSQDINVEEKNTHEKRISADIDSPFDIGLIVGSSGSGKTTLAREMFKDKFVEKSILDPNKAIIDQFPKEWTYDQCQTALSSIGLTSVPCWIREAKTLSNGQRFRAEVALQCAYASDDIVIIDEWTSVVDRTVAKVMSHCVQKFARSQNKKIILLSCHYDVTDWLQPDWIVDCNADTFECRRSLPKARTEHLELEIRECSPKYWKLFSKYHYLSHNLCGGKNICFGLFLKDDDQKIIGLGMYSNYVPGKMEIVHSNRVVIHPDYCGMNIAAKFVDTTAEEM